MLVCFYFWLIYLIHFLHVPCNLLSVYEKQGYCLLLFCKVNILHILEKPPLLHVMYLMFCVFLIYVPIFRSICVQKVISTTLQYLCTDRWMWWISNGVWQWSIACKNICEWCKQSRILKCRLFMKFASTITIIMQSVLHQVCSLFQIKSSKQQGRRGLHKYFLKSLYCKWTKWYRPLQQKATYTITFPLIVKQWSNFPCQLILNAEPILVTLYLVESCPKGAALKQQGAPLKYSQFSTEISTVTQWNVLVSWRNMLLRGHMWQAAHVKLWQYKVLFDGSRQMAETFTLNFRTLNLT